MTATSQLGFGCSRLMGHLARADSDRLLETALSVGITHFDVARSYGSGEAESVVGAFARRHVDEVTVTTKFGISPSTAQRSRVLRAAARRIMRLSPGARRYIQRRGAQMLSQDDFGLDAAQASLGQSFAALALPRIDHVLLHDPAADLVLAPDALEWLRSLQRQGRIGALGIGTGLVEATAIVQRQPEIAAVVQVPHSVAAPATTVFAVAPGATIAHGVVAEAVAVYAQRPEFGASVLTGAGCAPDDTDALAAIAIAEAIDAGARRVLVSTTDHRRLARLAGSIGSHGSPEQVAAYRDARRAGAVERALG